MSKRRSSYQVDSTYSKIYDFSYGDFWWLNLDLNSGYRVQSLICSAPLFALEEDLRILGELDSYKDLGFELLVQREIDKNRVQSEMIANYLNKPDKVNFYPPIVVALIPTYTDQVKKKYSTSIKLEDDIWHVSVGSDDIIETFFIDENEDYVDSPENFVAFLKSRKMRYGGLKWDREKFNAIIIDGQHRFSSIRQFLEGKRISKSESFFPVNFVVILPDPSSGDEGISGMEYISIARELFIDINKNAKTVNHTRLILLDDRDLSRSIARGAIRQFNSLGKTPFYQWEKINIGKGRELEYLTLVPQEVVNWDSDISEMNSINTFGLAQFTSTTLLYKIVNENIIVPDKGEDIFDALFRVFELKGFVPSEEKEQKYYEELKRKRARFRSEIELIDEQIKEAKDEELVDPEVFKNQKSKLLETALLVWPPINRTIF